jgi:mono/diheme cytochrome c family protein
MRLVPLTAATIVVGALTVVSWSDRRDASDGTTPADPTATAVAGSSLFLAKGCAACHGALDGAGDASSFHVAPSLAGAAEWAGERRSGLDAEAYLRESISDPGVFMSPAWSAAGGPTTGMPTLVVTDAELTALVDYLLGA